MSADKASAANHPQSVRIIVQDGRGGTIHWDDAHSWAEARRILREFQDMSGRLVKS